VLDVLLCYVCGGAHGYCFRCCVDGKLYEQSCGGLLPCLLQGMANPACCRAECWCGSWAAFWSASVAGVHLSLLLVNQCMCTWGCTNACVWVVGGGWSHFSSCSTPGTRAEGHTVPTHPKVPHGDYEEPCAMTRAMLPLPRRAPEEGWLRAACPDLESNVGMEHPTSGPRRAWKLCCAAVRPVAPVLTEAGCAKCARPAAVLVCQLLLQCVSLGANTGSCQVT
jgi:hypothetical protein